MSETCSYTVNEDNILIDVGGSWSRFACDNDAPELQEPAPLGRSLFDFIGDRTTAQLYLQVLTQVRRRQRTQAFDIRCDGPTVRRFLRITFAPAPHGGVSVKSELLREESRDAVRLLDPAAARGGELLKSCSWCERVSIMGGWFEIEEAAARLRLFDAALLPVLTHGICADCLDRVERELALP